ncbi:MAG: M64 family metallopeptidase [Bradymonadaceae bacterium]
MPRNSRSLLPLLAILATTLLAVALTGGCGIDSSTVDDGTGVLRISDSPTGAPRGADLSPGEKFETNVESREALLVILKGSVSTNTSNPYSATLVRAIDAPIFLDVDQNEGHDHWITRAEVEDAEGNLIWTTRTNSLFQLLEFLQLLLAQQSTINLNAQQVFSLVRSQYPQLLEFAVRVPLGLDGAKDYVLRVPDEAGNLLEVMRLDIEDLVAGKEAPRFEGDIETIIETGPSADRIEIAILGDGYTAAERTKFELDAQAVAHRLLETSPFSEHREFFNIRTVWTPSAESGAGFDCLLNQAGCENHFRDTAFGTVFVIPAIADRFNMDVSDISDRVAMPVEIGKAFEVAALASFDEIIMIANTRKHAGFAGLYVALVTSFDDRRSFPDVAVHELGHTFGILGDEYMVQGDPCFFNEPRIPLPANIATLSAPEDLKWDHWLRENTPVPTAPASNRDFPVGAYQGAYNCAELLRPSYNCMMKSSGQNFCPVCAEQMVRRFYSVVDPSPLLPASVERVDDETLRFEIPMWENSDHLLVTWTLNGEEISNTATLNFTNRRFGKNIEPNIWTELIATVRDDSGFTRLDEDELVQTFTWWVKRETGE